MTNININKNNSLKALHELVEQSIDKKLSYMPESYNQQQHQALQLFKERLFLEKIIDETISFNKSIVFPNENKNLHLAVTAADLIDPHCSTSRILTSYHPTV